MYKGQEVEKNHSHVEMCTAGFCGDLHICTKPPNCECFSAVTWGWMYPSAFPTQSIVPNHEAFPGLRVQGTANRLAPPPMMFPCSNSNHFLKIDGKSLTQTSSLQPTVCEMRNLYCIHTTPSPDTHQATFPTCQVSSLTASQLCALSKLLYFWTLGAACK